MRFLGGDQLLFGQRRFLSVLLFVSFFSFDLGASRPDQETSAENCRKALKAKSFLGERPEFSASSLIPVGELIKTMKDPFLAKLHVQGSLHQKSHPTPGLMHMYRTASSAADALVDSTNVKAIRPEYPPSDLLLGAAATEALMLDPAKQPEFIRDAVLIREGVVMIVPILKKIQSKDGVIYAPIIVKGHQELQREDDLRALFAAWALARTFGSYPPYAEVYLRPMAKVRDLNNPDAPNTRQYVRYHYVVEDHIQDVEEIHRRYIELISSADELSSARARRSTETMKSPWAAYIRELLAEQSDLSMMPYPPSREQAARLQALGFGRMEELAQLDVSSWSFWELSLRSGVGPNKLRYFVAHSKAATSDQPILLNAYEDPFEGADYLVHVDFEDIMSRQLRSGVYLFGAKLEDLKSRKKDRIVDEAFVWADDLKPTEVSEAWAEFIRFIKDNKKLKNKEFRVTVYSHHEMTKFHQEFDIVKAKPADFTAAQRRSKYYWQSEDGKQAKLIRNQRFFQKYKDISPQDVFRILERTVDLYQYILRNFAFPTYSNGLKHVIEYISEEVGFEVKFPDGHNGLESIEWAMRAYQTWEQSLFDLIEEYNRVDVDGNIAVSRYIRENAGWLPPDDLTWSEEVIDELYSLVAAAAQARRHVDSLLERGELLSKILGKPVGSLSSAQLSDLEKILDREAYLSERKLIEESKELDRAEKDQELQRIVYEFRTARKAQLLSFFEKTGKFKRSESSDELLESLADFFLIHRLDDYSKRSLQKMLILERLKPEAKKLRKTIHRSLKERLVFPEEWDENFKTLDHEKLLKDTEVEVSELRQMWRGLYYRYAFPVSEIEAKN